MNFLNKQSNVLFIIFIIAISFRIGIAYALPFFKYLGVTLLIILTFSSIKLLFKLKNYVDWTRVKPIILVFLLYPFISILIEVINNLSIKSFTDGFFIRFPYYLLSVIALAQCVLLVSNDNFSNLIKGSLPRIQIISAFLILTVLDINEYGDANLLLANAIIPFCFLSFSRKRSVKLIGILFIIISIFFVNKIASRSFFLVNIYIIFFLFRDYIYSSKRREFRIIKKIQYLIIFLLLLVFLKEGVFNQFLGESSLLKKINIESLSESINSNPNSIYEKEYVGDSRTHIIVDAFSDFSIKEFLIGRGIFGKYESFITRNTIEIGWLQEAFWFGFVSVIIILIISIRSAFLCIKSTNQTIKILGVILFVKILDAFIYGMPVLSIYNYLFLMGIFAPFIKINREEIQTASLHH